MFSSITEFGGLTPGSNTIGITTGPDGNLWFAEYNNDAIGKITPGGAVTEFPLNDGGNPNYITAGPDGNLWFTEQSSDQIGRITTSGQVTLFALPSGSQPTEITAGPDGNLWFDEYGTDSIGSMTTSGVPTEYSVPGGSGPLGIAAGSDGNIWFTELTGNNIGRLSLAAGSVGAITQFAISAGAGGYGITAGPDGNLWFAEAFSDKIGKITPTGVYTEYATPTPNSSPPEITAGPDGNLYFTESGISAIGEITTSGIITETPTPTPNSSPSGITVGPDGNIWFAEGADQIGRLSLQAPTTTTLAALSQDPVAGQNVVLTADVTSMSGTPTGTVNFTDGSTTLGTGNLVNGTATITGDFAAGTHSIVATYSGDATFATSASASSSVTADQTTTTSLVALSQDPIAGQNVVLTSNVISSAGTPTGTMTFTDGSTTLGTVSIVNGSATITGNFIAGAHQILATYNGDAGFAPSISATMPVTADPTASATAGHTLPAIVASVTPTAQLIKYTLAAVNSGVHLYGKTTVWSRNGHVAFSNINIKQAGTYLLMISTPGQGTILQEAAVITPGPASTVVFTTQPANTTPSSAFSVAVTIEDAYKNIAISAADAVTLSLRSHGKQATLIGTTVVSPANGTVMFANLSVPSAGTYRLLARYGTAGAATFSTVFTVATAAPPL